MSRSVACRGSETVRAAAVSQLPAAALGEDARFGGALVLGAVKPAQSQRRGERR